MDAMDKKGEHAPLDMYVYSCGADTSSLSIGAPVPVQLL